MKLFVPTVVALATLALVGCGTYGNTTGGTMGFGSTQAATASAANLGMARADTNYGDATADLPPAKPGQCYARVVSAAQFGDVTERVLSKAAASRIETVPATFQTADERVMVKPETRRLEIVPARYETVNEQIVTKPASTRLESVPAVYETVSEQVLDTPARMVWKRSAPGAGVLAGSLQTAAQADGSVLCLVEEPATYRTVTRQALKSPATAREIAVPAETSTVTKTRLVSPETTREVVIPAEFSTVKVQKLVTPATQRVIEVPAEYQTVTKRVQTAAAKNEWREILCENNMTASRLASIQAALGKAGFNPGRTDGVFSAETLKAVNAYQAANRLPVDPGQYINIATVNALGIR